MSRTIFTGRNQTADYDTIGQLTRIKALNNSNATLHFFSYPYTDPGNSNKYTLTRFGMTDVSGNNWSYGYDPLVCSTSAVEKNSGGSTIASYAYGYDPVDSMTSSSGPSGSQAMTYNSADELATQNGSSTGIAFDADGNQTGGPSGTALAYNAQDQTTTITPPGPLGHRSGTPISMTYRGLGQSRRTGNGTTSYVYDQTGMLSWGASGQNPTPTTRMVTRSASGCTTRAARGATASTTPDTSTWQVAERERHRTVVCGGCGGSARMRCPGHPPL